MLRGNLVPFLFLLCCNWSVCGQSPRKLLRRHRRLAEQVVSRACNVFRVDPYPARLDIMYKYVITFKDDTIDVEELQRAISIAIAHQLDLCDYNGRPMLAVAANSGIHSVSESNDISCAKTEDFCYQIRAVTSIFLDQDTIGVERLGLQAISNAINNTSLIRDLTGFDLTYSTLSRVIQTSLILLSSDRGEIQLNPARQGPTGIAIAAAAVSFLLTGIFLYGRCLSKMNRVDGRPVKRCLAHLQGPGRSYFENLPDDDALHCGWVTPQESGPKSSHDTPPSQTWSESDLTASDSLSIRSNLPLDPIDEECPFDDETSETPDGHDVASLDKPVDERTDYTVASMEDESQLSFSSSEEMTPPRRLQEGRQKYGTGTAEPLLHSINTDDNESVRGCQFLVEVRRDGIQGLSWSFSDDSDDTVYQLEMTKASYDDGSAIAPMEELPSTPPKPLTPPKPNRVTSHTNEWNELSADSVQLELPYCRRKPCASSSLRKGGNLRLAHPHRSTDIDLLVWWVRLVLKLERGRIEPRLTN